MKKLLTALLILPALHAAEVMPPLAADVRSQITSNATTSATVPVVVAAVPRLSTVLPWQTLAAQLGFVSWQWATDATVFAVPALAINVTATGSLSTGEAFTAAATTSLSRQEIFQVSASGQLSVADILAATASGAISKEEAMQLMATAQQSQTAVWQTSAASSLSREEIFSASAKGQLALTDLLAATAQGLISKEEAITLSATATATKISLWQTNAAAMVFTQGDTLLFELQLPSNYSKASAVGLALRGGTPEALANGRFAD